MMRKWTAQRWDWMRHHRIRSISILIVLLVGMVFGLPWTIDLIRFGSPPPTGQNCGSIVHVTQNPEQSTPANATSQVQTCFWQSYQSCQAATMQQTEVIPTEGEAIYTITIEQRYGHCAIYGQEKLWLGTSTTYTTFLCNHPGKEEDKLQLSDCDGIEDFVL